MDATYVMKIINLRQAVQSRFGETQDKMAFFEAMGVKSDSIPKQQWKFISDQLTETLQQYFIKWLVDCGHIHIGMVRNNDGSVETLQQINEKRLIWKNSKGRAISGRNIVYQFSELWNSLPEN